MVQFATTTTAAAAKSFSTTSDGPDAQSSATEPANDDAVATATLAWQANSSITTTAATEFESIVDAYVEPGHAVGLASLDATANESSSKCLYLVLSSITFY